MLAELKGTNMRTGEQPLRTAVASGSSGLLLESISGDELLISAVHERVNKQIN